jgi:hypothetical protein
VCAGRQTTVLTRLTTKAAGDDSLLATEAQSPNVDADCAQLVIVDPTRLLEVALSSVVLQRRQYRVESRSAHPPRPRERGRRLHVVTRPWARGRFRTARGRSSLYLR